MARPIRFRQTLGACAAAGVQVIEVQRQAFTEQLAQHVLQLHEVGTAAVIGGDRQMRPVAEDQMRSFIGLVVIERDAQGAVRGLRLDGGRVRDVRFVRTR